MLRLTMLAMLSIHPITALRLSTSACSKSMVPTALHTCAAVAAASFIALHDPTPVLADAAQVPQAQATPLQTSSQGGSPSSVQIRPVIASPEEAAALREAAEKLELPIAPPGSDLAKLLSGEAPSGGTVSPLSHGK
jgi:hypothetical protein